MPFMIVVPDGSGSSDFSDLFSKLGLGNLGGSFGSGQGSLAGLASQYGQGLFGGNTGSGSASTVQPTAPAPQPAPQPAAVAGATPDPTAFGDASSQRLIGAGTGLSSAAPTPGSMPFLGEGGRGGGFLNTLQNQGGFKNWFG